MTVCLKCGADNPDDGTYCGRCEMPLPAAKAGDTLTGGSPAQQSAKAKQSAAAGPATGALPSVARPAIQQAPPAAARSRSAAKPALPGAPPDARGATLFGGEPGGPSRAFGSKRNDARPIAQGHTLFGVAPPQGLPDRMPPQGPLAAVPPPQGLPARVPPPQVPPSAAPGGSGAKHQTLVGVMPDDLARAIDASRAPAGPPIPAAQRHGTIVSSLASNPFQPVPNRSSRLDPPAAPPLGQGARPTGETATPLAAPHPTPHPATTPAADPPRIAIPQEPLHLRTAVGVAMPGIAPLRPGAGPAPAQTPAARTFALDATRLEGPESTPGSFVLPGRSQLPRSALVLIGAGVVLAAAAAAFALLWNVRGPLHAIVGTDSSGKERLDIVCESCPDGTRISLNGVSTEVSQLKAYLAPAETLPLGEPTLSFELQRPGDDIETVEVTLPPLEYRIRPDTSSLVGDSPSLTLAIEALPGSQVTIGTLPVPLDERGRGKSLVDVRAQLTGPSREVVTFEQKTQYEIVPPSGKTYTGQLGVKIGVTPLILEAPGSDSITALERFMLAGRTVKGAEVWVAGNAIAVDDEGRFAQLMSIDSVGKTEVSVRAGREGLAPRFVTFQLERVDNLNASAAKLAREAIDVANVAADIPANIGKLVVIKGRVAQASTDGQRKLIIVELPSRCDDKPCLVRLVYGGLSPIKEGAAIDALGRVSGAVSTSGTGANVPEVEVSLLR